MAHAVSVNGLTLGTPVPDDLEGPIEVAFVLPGGAPLRCRGRVDEIVVGDGEEERAERRAIRFLDLDQDGAARIQAYVEERLGLA